MTTRRCSDHTVLELWDWLVRTNGEGRAFLMFGIALSSISRWKLWHDDNEMEYILEYEDTP